MRSDAWHLHAGGRTTYFDDGLVSKTTLRIAQDLLDRFFRDAEGKTNRQLDVYFTLQDLDISREKADPAIEFLVSRGLLNLFGPDIAFLTDKGVRVVVDEADLVDLPKEVRDFGPPQPPSPPSVVSAPPVPAAPTAGVPTSSRPDHATLTHIDLDGQEFVVELQDLCTIGRADGNTIRIGDKRASKNHAEIRYEAGQFVLRDLQSANGTLVNGQYVVQPVILNHDDEVVIGRTMLLFATPRQATGDLPGTPSEPATIASQRPMGPGPAATPVPLSPISHPGLGAAPAHAAESAEAAAAFRVIQGTPDPVPQRRPHDGSGPISVPPNTADLELPEQPDPRPARADLFDESSQRGRTDDLFTTERKRDDLFDRTSSSADALLFGEGPASDTFGQAPAAHPPAEQDLFAPAPESQDLYADSGPTTHPAAPQLDVVPLAEGLQPSLQEPLEELEPFESLDDEPEAGWADDRPSSGAPLLENQPVVHGGTDPISESLAQPSEDMATLLVSREDLFGQDEPEPPHWADARSAPAFQAEAPQPATVDEVDLAHPEPGQNPLAHLMASVEDLPVAEAAVAALVPRDDSITRTDPAPLGPRGTEFVNTLVSIRERIEQVDVPEKGALLQATEVLSQHPYVRVVLESLED